MQPQSNLRRTSLLILGMAIVTVSAIVYDNSQAPRTIQAASAVSASVPAAANGAAIYEQNCMSCHAAEGKGSGKYPALTGEAFKKKFTTYDKAYEFISSNMPQNAPGTLREDEYKAVAKYIMALNGAPTDFNDIQGYWGENEIKELFDKRYIDGYQDKQAGTLSFKPDQNITRAEFVRYLVKSKELFLSNNTETEFTDLSSLNKENQTYIMTAVDYGLINGYPDHTFRPKASITRAEIAAILARSEMLKPAGEGAFVDVPADYWASDAIRALRQAHLFDGYEDGTFRPDQKMTRGEAVAVIYRLIHPSK